MRVFVAIDIPAAIRTAIGALLGELKRAAGNARWSRPEGLHITLKFLGEVPDSRVEDVKARLQALPPRPAARIRVARSGFFPNEHAPRVLWLGIEAGAELARLAATIDRGMAALGIPKEDRAFSPHLTLARIRPANSNRPLLEALRSHAPLDFGAFTPEAFYLYESRPSPGGSIYTKVAGYALAPPEGRPAPGS